MKLENVVPWGRNLEEYKNIFNLSNQDLQSKILGCGDTPSSFNFEKEKKEKRYIYNELLKLSFEDASFDLVLSSHFLFFYSKHFDLQFQIDSILEISRISKKLKEII